MAIRASVPALMASASHDKRYLPKNMPARVSKADRVPVCSEDSTQVSKLTSSRRRASRWLRTSGLGRVANRREAATTCARKIKPLHISVPPLSFDYRQQTSNCDYCAFVCGAAADIASLGPQETSEVKSMINSDSNTTFSWTKQWYPVAVEKWLKTDRPTPVRLLGEAFVLWRDKNKEWHCWKDRCPHRMAPLSEGRVEDGELMCSYHGWTFGPDGKCTNIPQAHDSKILATSLSSRRACTTTHPLKVKFGLVWVWAEGGETAVEDSKIREPLLHPSADKPDTLWITNWFMRDVPYGNDVLAENLLDPAHVSFSHHGVLGDRKKPSKLSMSTAVFGTPQEGLEVTVEREIPGKPPAVSDLTWQPPSLIKYTYGNGMIMSTHATPTDPGRCRIFFSVIQPADRATTAMKIMLPLLFPPWLLWRAHFNQQNVLDGDSVFLHHQDESLQRLNWKNNYWMPTDNDTAVLAGRRWFTDIAGPIPWGPGALPRPRGLPARELLERYYQHTQHCPSCSAALKVFTALTAVAAAAAALSTAAFVRTATSAAHWKLFIKPGLLTVVFAIAAAFCARIRQRFLFVPYNHFEHN